MLQKKSRLPSKEFRSGAYRTVKTPYFLLKVKPSAAELSRVGVVAGTAVHKRAVKRNFWKRQAKTALSKAGKGKDFLIIFSSKVNELTKAQFSKEISKAIKQF